VLSIILCCCHVAKSGIGPLLSVFYIDSHHCFEMLITSSKCHCCYLVQITLLVIVSTMVATPSGNLQPEPWPLMCLSGSVNPCHLA